MTLFDAAFAVGALWTVIVFGTIGLVMLSDFAVLIVWPVPRSRSTLRCYAVETRGFLQRYLPPLQAWKADGKSTKPSG